METEYIYKGYKISIGYDQWAESPEEWGNYTIKEWRDVEGIDADERTVSDELAKKLDDGRAFWVDKYEHSGSSYTLMGEGMNDRWDTTQQWGIIEFTDEYATNFDDYEGRKEMARGDLRDYTAYANGEVYQSYIYEVNPHTGENIEQIDGSGGFFSYDEAKQQAEDTIDSYEPPRSSKYAKKAQEVHA